MAQPPFGAKTPGNHIYHFSKVGRGWGEWFIGVLSP